MPFGLSLSKPRCGSFDSSGLTEAQNGESGK
jgi:hypothetical protein